VEIRATREAEARAEVERTELSFEEVALFGESHNRWLKTPGGTWFVPAGDRFVALKGDDEAGYFAAWGCTDPRRRHEHGYIGEAGERVDIETAMGRAEAWIDGEDVEVYAGQDRAWRKRKPTEAQSRYALRLGVRVEPHHRAGDVGDGISAVLVARRLGERKASA
jgi:hypothetical protein